MHSLHAGRASLLTSSLVLYERVGSATENRVYLKPGNRSQLETKAPGTGPIDPPPGGDHDYVYPDGIGSYKPGETVVNGTDGKLYARRPLAEGAWCNINADAYRLGTGDVPPS